MSSIGRQAYAEMFGLSRHEVDVIQFCAMGFLKPVREPTHRGTGFRKPVAPDFLTPQATVLRPKSLQPLLSAGVRRYDDR